MARPLALVVSPSTSQVEEILPQTKMPMLVEVREVLWQNASMFAEIARRIPSPSNGRFFQFELKMKETWLCHSLKTFSIVLPLSIDGDRHKLLSNCPNYKALNSRDGI